MPDLACHLEALVREGTSWKSRKTSTNVSPNVKKDKPMFKCDQCDYTTTLKYRMGRHKRIHNQDFFYCDLCPSRFTESCRLLAHTRTRHGGTVAKCNICGGVFPSEQSMDEHKISQHAQDRYVCQMCNTVVHGINNYVTHLDDQHQIKP